MITEKQMYRVMWVNPQGGTEVNTSGFNSENDAWEYIGGLKDMFPNESYYVDRYIDVTRTYSNSNSVDGWEDMYPLDEY